MIAKHDRRVMLGVTRAVYERHRSLARDGNQVLDRRLMVPQFRDVSPPEFRPFSRIMSEPPSEFSAGCYLLHPFGERQFALAYAAWPETLDEEACAVGSRGWFICSLQLDHVDPPITGWYQAAGFVRDGQ